MNSLFFAVSYFEMQLKTVEYVENLFSEQNRGVWNMIIFLLAQLITHAESTLPLLRLADSLATATSFFPNTNDRVQIFIGDNSGRGYRFFKEIN